MVASSPITAPQIAGDSARELGAHKLEFEEQSAHEDEQLTEDASPVKHLQAEVLAVFSVAKQRWQAIIRTVVLALKVSDKFYTLRAMYEFNTIKSEELSKVKNLGKGAFSTVHLCKLNRDGSTRLVAIKRPNAAALDEHPTDPEIIKEGKLLRKLKHQHITNYIGFGTETTFFMEDMPFLAQEPVVGGGLRKLVQKQMDNPSKVQYRIAEALTWCQQVASALAYMHTRRPTVAHRDLKLENILLRNHNGRREAVLCDLGLAVSIKHGRQHDPRPEALQRQKTAARPLPSVASLKSLRGGLEGAASGSGKGGGGGSGRGGSFRNRHKGSMVRMDSMKVEEMFNLTGETGSLVYMAPEVIKHEPYNEKIDVYSFGVIVYELFGRGFLAALVLREAAVPSLDCIEDYLEKVGKGYRRHVPRQWPECLRKLIYSCWEQKPRNRPSMLEVFQLLNDPAFVEEVLGPNHKEAQHHEALTVETTRTGCTGCSGCSLM